MHPKEQGARSLCPPRTGVTACLGLPSREPDRFSDPLIVWFLATTVRILSVRRISSVVRDGVVCVSGILSKSLRGLTCIYFISEGTRGVDFPKQKERKKNGNKKKEERQACALPGKHPGRNTKQQIDQLDLGEYLHGARYEQSIKQVDTSIL